MLHGMFSDSAEGNSCPLCTPCTTLLRSRPGMCRQDSASVSPGHRTNRLDRESTLRPESTHRRWLAAPTSSSKGHPQSAHPGATCWSKSRSRRSQGSVGRRRPGKRATAHRTAWEQRSRWPSNILGASRCTASSRPAPVGGSTSRQDKATPLANPLGRSCRWSTELAPPRRRDTYFRQGEPRAAWSGLGGEVVVSPEQPGCARARKIIAEAARLIQRLDLTLAVALDPPAKRRWEPVDARAAASHTELLPRTGREVPLKQRLVRERHVVTCAAPLRKIAPARSAAVLRSKQQVAKRALPPLTSTA